MKKTLLFGALSLTATAALALPFQPTSDPSLASTYWYFLKTDGYYMVANPDDQDLNFPATVANSDGYNLWCFVGDEESGYRVYNKGKDKFLSLGNFLPDNPATDQNWYVRVEPHNDLDFYLRFDGFGEPQYLYMRTFVDDQHGDTRYMDVAPYQMGAFSVELAIAGVKPPEDSSWTRQDANGVKYAFVQGCQSPVEGESIASLLDNNAATKYYGSVDNYWFVMSASAEVAVKQYSIVTANDSRQHFERTLRSWKLQGSTDYVTWVDIDVRMDWPMPIVDQQEVVFTVNDNRKFRFFKFIATQGVSEKVQLSEVWINEQKHNWGYATTDVMPSCGDVGQLTRVCDDCQVQRWEFMPPTGVHNIVDGICSECHLREHETILLRNGQYVPYFMTACRDFRSDSGSWPEPPAGWPSVGNYDASQWSQVLMPIASPGHSMGPFSYLYYNSNWYGEYNCYYFVRQFNLPHYDSDATFTFRCVHDDNMVVYVNGQEVINAQGWTPNADTRKWIDAYESFTIPASAFRAGPNVLAVYIQQNWGGAYFDCELMMKGSGSVALVGDVNGDDEVSIADVTMLVDLLLRQQSNERSDVNGDGETSIADLTALVGIVAN